uniref:LAGLIDADG domain containing endonuclease n=1 Tax=Pseudocercospora fijiensis TaxID=1873960 RepID=A0A516EZM7_9PEZI|nr:LAGLIDADG domain containing endonuclease [Pseudocercospora fijiensis]QDO71955.1 LAGLIDADG domain containing endonuclease [Pseudocercospora fijiensis]
MAGVIDGDGQFLLSKKGSARLYIVMDIRDKNALYEIKHRFGGSIRPVSNSNALRYNLSNKLGLTKLITAINGQIRNPTRLLQMNKLCLKYDIKLVYPSPLTFYNGWFSGFLDSDGSVYFNEQSSQVIISITQKNIYLLEPLIYLYGGRVNPSNSKGIAFKYIIYRKEHLFNMIDKYFSRYKLKTLKHNRINMIKEFYTVTISDNNKDIFKLNEWVKFKEKWNNYKD